MTKVRVACPIKGDMIAAVEDDIYLTNVVDEWEVEKIRRLQSSRPGRSSRSVQRLRPQSREVQVYLFGEDADRFQIDSKWWGNLPAGCRRCGAIHLVRVADLRAAVHARRREVLAQPEALH